MVEKTQENTTFIINETTQPCSYEFGKAGNRFKLYFDDAQDLFKQIENLKKFGLYEEDGK